MYRATDIAKWFIEKGIKENKPITSMKALKLTYIAQGLHLAAYDEALFIESCQAWRYGPVVFSVYQHTKKYKDKPIIDENTFGEKCRGVNPEDKLTISLLKKIWETFESWDAYELSTWSHRAGSAWDIAYNKEDGKKYIGYDISADLLKEEFSKILKSPPTLRNSRPGWLTHAE